MRILYIGGTGEISLACVASGVALGQEITVFTRGRQSEPLPPGVQSIVGDMNDSAAYRDLGRRSFDVVCQFNAFDMARIHTDLDVFGGRVAQYVFISTASAYQKPPASYLITEQTPLANPYWPYSRAKIDMEQQLTRWHQSNKLPVTIVRPSHTYRTKYPGTFVGGDVHAWRMLNHRPVIVHGDGTSLWVLTHADDFARYFVRLLGNPRAIGEAFHITSDTPATWNDIFRTIGASLGVEPMLVHVPSETLIRYNAQWAGPLLEDKTWPVIFDNSKVKSIAGEAAGAGRAEDLAPKISLAEGYARVAPYYHQRAKSIEPDLVLHALLDRIAMEQQALGK